MTSTPRLSLYRAARAVLGRFLQSGLGALLPALRRLPGGTALLLALRRHLPGPWQALRARFGPAGLPPPPASPFFPARRPPRWQADEQRLLRRLQKR